MPAPKNTPTPRQARSHPPLKAWLTSETNIHQLREILAHPVFLAAEHYVLADNQVSVTDLNVALPEVIVRKAALHAGMREAFDGMRKLVIANTPVEQMEPWAHILSPTQ